MKILIMSDSFKGTLSSKKIIEIFTKAFNETCPNDTLLSKEIADGGEGTLDAIYSNIGGTFIDTLVKGPYFENVKSHYLVNKDTAYIELASSSGLPKVENKKNPLLTTTYGCGEEIKDAISKGYKKIVIACGGSSTNDAGVGALSALGVKFYDESNKEFIPTGSTLFNIKFIDDNILKEYKDIEFSIMSDCKNPMFGKYGAAYIYAPQKGASKEDVILLDNNLKYINYLFISKYNIDLSNTEGAGAAGAFPAGFMYLFNAKIKSGIETLLSSMNFDDLIKDVDYIITGEGKFDSQSINGKVISGILNHTRKANKKVIIVSGMIDEEIYNINLNDLGIYKIYETSNNIRDFNYIKENAEQMYYKKAIEILEELK